MPTAPHGLQIDLFDYTNIFKSLSHSNHNNSFLPNELMPQNCSLPKGAGISSKIADLKQLITGLDVMGCLRPGFEKRSISSFTIAIAYFQDLMGNLNNFIINRS
jgi:hypothetical protein